MNNGNNNNNIKKASSAAAGASAGAGKDINNNANANDANAPKPAGNNAATAKASINNTKDSIKKEGQYEQQATLAKNGGVSSHVLLAVLACCAVGFFASGGNVGFGGGGARTTLSSWFSSSTSSLSSKYNTLPACSNHGIVVSPNDSECFCDLGYSGVDCEISSSAASSASSSSSSSGSAAPSKNLKKNSVLLVTEAFSSVLPQTASSADYLIAASYEELAVKLTAEGVAVDVLIVGDVQQAKKAEAVMSVFAAKGVTVTFAPLLPVTLQSPTSQKSYAVLRHLQSLPTQYETIQSPSHSSLLFHTLQARHQNLLECSQTAFVTHLSALPPSAAARLENSDPSGSGYGKSYGGSEADLKEALVRDYMQRVQSELSDGVFVGGVGAKGSVGEYVTKELKWKVKGSVGRVQEFYPAVNAAGVSASEGTTTIQPNEDIEIVFVGAPDVGVAGGIKVVADALDLLKTKLPSSGTRKFSITFLGSSAQLANPKLSSEEFLEYRSYNWPGAYKFVKAGSVGDVLSYLTASRRRLAVLPEVLSTTGSSYLLSTLLSNGVSVLASRTPLSEDALHYDDWEGVFFAPNNSKALVEKLMPFVKVAEQSVVLPLARVNTESSVGNKPVDGWKSVFAAALPKETCEASNVGGAAIDGSELPLISVVIVHHNRVELLKQALKSIEEQSYPQDRLEVILVDDGSTDVEAVQYINNLAWLWWETKGWKVVREPQRWVGAARNVGVRYAKGEYVMFLDDDDVAKSEKIAMMTRVAMRTRADVVTSGHDLFSSEFYPQSSSASGARGRYLPLGAATSAGIFQNVFGDAGFMVKKSFFTEIGGFTEDFGVGFEDYEFLARVALDPQARLEAIPEALTWYRKLGDRSSLTDNTELKQNQIRVMRPFVDRFPFQAVHEQNLLRVAQDHLFVRSSHDEGFVTGLNNGTCSYDQCGECNGDGTSCVDCNGIFQGPAVQDRCGICEGDGTSCFIVSDVVPGVIFNSAGTVFTLLGAGFADGMIVSVNGIDLDVTDVEFQNAGLLKVTVPNPTPFQDYFDQNPEVLTEVFPIYVDGGGAKGHSNIKYITVVTSSLVSEITPVTLVKNSADVITITGTYFFDFPTTACWFLYTELQWNSDFTAEEFKEAWQSTVATFVDDTTITCEQPYLYDSTDAVVQISYSGVGYDGVYDEVTGSVIKVETTDFIPLDKATDNNIRFTAAAPVVDSAILSDDGIFTYIYFDADTNGLDLPETFTCADLFVVDPEAAGLDVDTYAKLSDGVEGDCEFGFSDPMTLWISIKASVAANNPDTVIGPGKIVRFQENILHADGERFFDFFNGDSTIIDNAENPQQPEVFIEASALLGVCAIYDFDLSSSDGDGGRYFKDAVFTGEYVAAPGSTHEAALQAELDKAAAKVLEGEMFFEFDPEAFTGPSSKIKITVSLTNFMGQTGSDTWTLEYFADNVIPSVLMVGPSGGKSVPGADVAVSGFAEFDADEACLISHGVATPDEVTMVWQMTGPAEEIGTFDPEEIGLGDDQLLIPAYWFGVGLHQFELDIILGAETYKFPYELEYVYDSLAVSVEGGSKTISATVALDLIADVTDPTWADDAELESHMSEYTYSWTCKKSTPSGLVDCPGTVALTAVRSQSIAAGLLPPTTGQDCYLFTVTLTHPSTSRTAPANFACISVIKAVIPAVKLTRSIVRPLAGATDFFLKAEVTNADLFADTTLNYNWIARTSCDKLSFPSLDLSGSNVVSPPNQPILQFRTSPPALQPMTSYCIAVIVRASNAPAGVFSQAFMRFTTRQEPSGGICNVVGAATGVQLTTEFTFSCTGWNTDSKNGDIFYTFSTVDADGKKSALGSKSKASTYKYIFGAAGSLNVVVDITDSFGGYARTVPRLAVTVTAGGDVNAFLDKQKKDFAATKNANAALKGVSAGTQSQKTQGGNVKREISPAQQSLLDQISGILNATNVEHVDVGPVMLNMFSSLLSTGLTVPILQPSMDILQGLANKMNKAGRDARTCFNTNTAVSLLAILNDLCDFAATAPGYNATTILSYREPILQVFSACVSRQTLCGSAANRYNAGSTNSTIGTIDPSTGLLNLGNFAIPNLEKSMKAGPSECLNFRFTQGTNYLPGPNNANSSIGTVLFAVDFRNVTLNAGGVRRGVPNPVPALGSDLLTPTFDPPINLTLPVDSKYMKDVLSGDLIPECAFYQRSDADFTKGAWATDGCKVIQNATAVTPFIICSCNHLTEYAISISQAPARGRGSTNPQPPNVPNPNPNPTPGPGPLPEPSPVGAIVGSIVAVVGILGVIGFLGYKRVERTKAFDANRVAPLEDTTPAKPEMRIATVRDPSMLPAYFLPPSYDEHMALKNASTAETKRQEKLSVLLKEQTLDEDPRKTAELP